MLLINVINVIVLVMKYYVKLYRSSSFLMYGNALDHRNEGVILVV